MKHSVAISTLSTMRLNSSSSLVKEFSALASSAVWLSSSITIGDSYTLVSSLFVPRHWSCPTLTRVVCDTASSSQHLISTSTLTLAVNIIPSRMGRTDTESSLNTILIDSSLHRVHWTLTFSMSQVSIRSCWTLSSIDTAVDTVDSLHSHDLTSWLSILISGTVVMRRFVTVASSSVGILVVALLACSTLEFDLVIRTRESSTVFAVCSAQDSVLRLFSFI